MAKFDWIFLFTYFFIYGVAVILTSIVFDEPARIALVIYMILLISTFVISILPHMLYNKCWLKVLFSRKATIFRRIKIYRTKQQKSLFYLVLFTNFMFLLCSGYLIYVSLKFI